MGIRLPIVGAAMWGAALVLGGCQNPASVADAPPPPKSLAEIASAIPESRISTDAQKFAVAGIKLLDESQYEEASAEFNKGLALDVTNSRLHFLNGLSYHLRAMKGDAAALALAEQGYELAVQFDANNWVARYYLGRIRLDQKDYDGAREQLAEAVILHPEEPDLLYSLAVAAYYSQDLETAAGALDRLRQITPDAPKALEASSIVMAGLNRPAVAKSFLDQYKAVAKDDHRTRYLSRRLDDWKRFYVQVADNAPPPSPAAAEDVQIAQMPGGSTFGAPAEGSGFGAPLSPTGTTGEAAAPAEAGAAPAAAGEGDQHKMVIVDVVMIRTEEDHTTAKGVNLLNGLQLQFGSGATTPGFSASQTRTKTVGSVTSSLTRAIGIPAITYSLNIANANSKRNEILARPTLIAMNGLESKFFSGQNIVGVVVGGANSAGSTEKVVQDIGVELTVKPTFLPDGRIMLTARAIRTFLTTPNTTSITFGTRIDTSKTNVTANVAMNFGETLILSGLSEKETERTRDGVPGLQDVPLLQYFFSRATTRDFQKSALILLTPRDPNYVFREQPKSADGKPPSKRDKVLNELRARYADWFKPYPNWASVFHHMQNNKLYREFRTGDVELEKWDSLMTRSERWRQILDYLFY